MDNFSNLMLIGECLLDIKRDIIFKNSIEKTIKPGDIVLDAGTGSGILAMLAAKAGASIVYAVEINPDVCKIAESNIHQNGLTSVIKVLCTDVKKLVLPPVDVLIMEMLDTGLISEQQALAHNHLRKVGIITQNTKTLPAACQTYLYLVSYNFDFLGLKMPFILQARNNEVKKRIAEKVTNKVQVNNINFNKIIDLDFATKATVICKKTTVVNALVLESKLVFTPKIKVWGTSDMCLPVVIPVEPKKVTRNQRLAFNISYRMSEGFNNDNLRFEWIDYI